MPVTEQVWLSTTTANPLGHGEGADTRWPELPCF